MYYILVYVTSSKNVNSLSSSISIKPKSQSVRSQSIPYSDPSQTYHSNQKCRVDSFFFSCSPLPVRSPLYSATDDEENLSFLEDDETVISSELKYPHSNAEYSDDEDEEFENYDDLEAPSSFGHEEDDDEMAKIDEKDVYVLTDGNFSDFVD